MSLVLNGVSVRHPAASQRTTARSALGNISLAIAPGEQLALIGPSGAGKTTLLHTMACALQPHAGELQLFDTRPWSTGDAARHALRKRLFLAPQTPPLPPRQRVVTAVLAGLLPQWSLWKAFLSLLRPADPQLVYDALARFNLEDKLYARVDRLSGGERQRCSMARLLVSQAELFLVDEPLSALDPTLAGRTLGVLQQEAKARNAMLVCSLHQVELARAYFPRIVGLRDGQVVFDAPREQVSDDMIAALYRDAREPEAADTLPSDAMSAAAPMARCF